MPIRAITFDFWGTLFRDVDGTQRKQIRIDALSAATGSSHDLAAAVLHRMSTEFLRIHIDEQRTLHPRDGVAMVCAELGVSLDDGPAQRLAQVFAAAILEDPPVPVEDALEAVQAAAARCPVGVVSDTGLSPAASLRVLLDRNGFTPYFDAMAFSDEVGVAKPQAPMFECVAQGLGADAEEILHIGDLEPTDILGIQLLGGQAALFTAVNGRFADDTNAEYVITSWREFIDALPTLL